MYKKIILSLLQVFLLFSCKTPEPVLSDAVIWSSDYKTDSCTYKQKLELYDFNGNKVAADQINKRTLIQINVTNFKKGTYVLKMIGKNKMELFEDFDRPILIP